MKATTPPVALTAILGYTCQFTRSRLTIEAPWPSRSDPVRRVPLQALMRAGRGPVDVHAAPQPNQTRNIGLEFSQPLGRSWACEDAQAHDSDKVLVTLRPVPGGHPPYVVLTAMPSDTLPNS